MIKSIYLLSVISFVWSCSSKNEQSDLSRHLDTTPPFVVDSFFIPLDTANRMTGSYVASIASDPSTLQSLSINAEALRKYLADTSIKDMNIAFAHTTQYINEGNYGIPCGFSPSELTIVITGLNNSGETVNYNEEYALNRAKPCPPICLTTTLNNKH